MIRAIRWRELALFLLVLIAALILRWVLGHPLVVRTSAMAPTVANGDVVWVPQREPTIGDVVQVEVGGNYGLYRLVGIGGQVVELKEKDLFVDGVRTSTGLARTALVYGEDCRVSALPAVTAELGEHRFEFLPGGENARWVVPNGTVVVLGDHRDVAGDSRTWGAVPVSAIHGVAARVLWSWDQCSSQVRWHRIWNSIE